MNKPIIYYETEDGSIIIFESVEKAERYIEPIDLKIGDSVFFDSEGRILEAYVVEDSRGIEKTVITDSNEENFDKTKLRQILIDFLEYLNYSSLELEKMELKEIVKESLNFKTE